MKAKVIRIIIVAMIFSTVAGFTVQSDNTCSQIIAVIASAIVGAVMSSVYELIDTHGQGLATWFKSQILYHNKDLYISFSYLYKIEVDGKYLLVRGHRMKDRYQPIGGVYKYYPEARDFLDSIRFVPDAEFVNNNETDDLRIQIKGKYLLRFYDWFFSMRNREYDPSREFYEELIAPRFLDEDDFRQLRYRKVDVHNKGITKSIVPERIAEVIYADIFEVTLTDEQKHAVKRAVEEHPDDLCLAAPEEMRSRRYAGSVEMNLGNNVTWLLGEE